MVVRLSVFLVASLGTAAFTADRAAAGVLDLEDGPAEVGYAPADLYQRVLELCPRDDRVPERRVFEGVTGDRLRTRLARAATAAGVLLFSPHDLRHRRISLLHLAGVPWARIGEAVGHNDITTTSRVYTHVLADETEVDYEKVLNDARAVLTPVPPSYGESGC